MPYPWESLLDDRDRSLIDQAGYAEHGASSWPSRQLGSRPAILLIDMQSYLVGPDVPILDAIRTERTSIGQAAWRAIEAILTLLDEARKQALPIIYTRIIPQGRSATDPGLEIVPEVAPYDGDLVIKKRFASAFFGTPLSSHLIRLGTDTLIVMGNSTSGCVRATAVDAQQRGFGVLVPMECTFDRIQASHKIALLDLWMKYATVVPVHQARAYITGLSIQTEVKKE